MPPFVLKFKTNKPFDPSTDTLDAESLRRTWNVCTKVANCLEQGSRLENLTWRLWHMERQSESLKLREAKHQKEREAYELYRREEYQRQHLSHSLEMNRIHSPQPRHGFPSPNSLDWSSAPSVPNITTNSQLLSGWPNVYPNSDQENLVAHGLSPLDSATQFSPFGFSPSYASPPVSQAQLASSLAFALSPTSFFQNPIPDSNAPMFHSSYGSYQAISGPYSRFLTPSPEPSVLGSLEDLERDLRQFSTTAEERKVGAAGEPQVGTPGVVEGSFDNIWSTFDLEKSNENGMTIDPFAGMTIAGMSRGAPPGMRNVGGRPIFEVETESFDQHHQQRIEEDERKKVIRELEQIGRRGSSSSSLSYPNGSVRNDGKSDQEAAQERERMEAFERSMRGLTPPQGYTSFDYRSQALSASMQQSTVYHQSPVSFTQPLPPIASTSHQQYPSHHQQPQPYPSPADYSLNGNNNALSRLASTSLGDMRQWAHLQEATSSLSNTPPTDQPTSSSNPSPPSPPRPTTATKKGKGKKKFSGGGGGEGADPSKNKKFKNPHSTQLPAAASKTSTAMTDDSSTCSHCASTRTPLWRRGPADELLCNACGLYLKLHGTPRPKVFATQPIGVRGRLTTGAAAQAAASLTPPQCLNCEATSTPMWRKDGDGKLCCNACSLYFKLHNRVRPSSLSKKKKGNPSVATPEVPAVTSAPASQSPPLPLPSSVTAASTIPSPPIIPLYNPSPPVYNPSPPVTSYHPSPPIVPPVVRTGAYPSPPLHPVNTPTPPMPIHATSPLEQQLQHQQQQQIQVQQQQQQQPSTSPNWNEFHTVDRPPVFLPQAVVATRPPPPQHPLSHFSVPISNDRGATTDERERERPSFNNKRSRTEGDIGGSGGGRDWMPSSPGALIAASGYGFGSGTL